MVSAWKYRGWLCLSMVLLIGAYSMMTAQAQTEGWTHGCDHAALPAIAATTTQLDYAAMCQHVLDCDGVWCWIEGPMNMEMGCEDDLCRKRVWVYASAINAFDRESMWWNPEADRVIDRLISALDAFEAGDYAAAQDLFLATLHPLFELSAGLAAEANDDDTAALAIYDTAETREETYPLVYYLRGKVFARLDQTEAAAADFATFRRYIAADPELTAATEALSAAYPLDDLPFENWLVYPVLTMGYGPGGQWTEDQTFTAPSPVRIARIADPTRLVFEAAPEFFLYEDDPPPYLLRSPDANGLFQYNFDSVKSLYPWGVEFTLDLNSQPATGAEFSRGFESNAQQYILLAREGQPDPRE